MDFLKNIPII